MPKCIDNNTAAPIALYPTQTFPNGFNLLPGYNRIPDDYWDEFWAHEVMTEARPGKKAVSRFPGREQFEQWLKLVNIIDPDGRRRVGPMITVYEADQVEREEGPLAPQSLKGLREEQARAFIQVTTNRNDLKRWAQERSEFSNLAQTKLTGGLA